MNTKITAVLAILVVVGFAGTLYYQQRMNTSLLPSSPEQVAALESQVAAQQEDAFYQPTPQPASYPAPSDSNNVYFGDLHVHTSMSFDSYLFGNRLDMDTAYRVAKGEAVKTAAGETARLTRPLDFAALTDHAEGFGRNRMCNNPNLSAAGKDSCVAFDKPSAGMFLDMRNQGEKRPMKRSPAMFGGIGEATLQQYAAATWQEVKDTADDHNEPGKFTTFAGYEYSPPLSDRGKHHRNVFFRSTNTPKNAISGFDAASELDLWKQLEATCQDDCEFLTIPHNLNKTWGLAFAGVTIDGYEYTEADWQLRDRSEPLVEMFQVKGNSECSTAFGAGDEECGFEQFFPPCTEGAKPNTETSCIYPTAMARDGLHIGLALEDEYGLNPLKIGFVGSTDAHNSNPGDAEEWDFRGASGFIDSPAAQRLGRRGRLINNPGGLAAVWAPENTREALFDAMKRKEVYATSGNRIRLRVFAGYDLPSNIAETADLETAYKRGVPMGGTLRAKPEVPSLFVWALRDPDGAPIARVQIVKGWVENGERQERVYDIACGGSEMGASGRCVPNGASVDLSNCSIDQAAGATELKTLWTDPDYSADEDAFYYVRVVQNPTCRWTTYDALRLNQEPPEGSPATVTEMAWSSPIWIQAAL